MMPHKGTAMNTDENTPEIKPINNANEKLKIVGAPKMRIATTTTTTVNTVLIDLVIVCLIERLTISSICSGLVMTLSLCKFSLLGQM